MLFFFCLQIFVWIIDIFFGNFILILVTIVRLLFLLHIISLLTFLLTMLILAKLSFPIAIVVSIKTSLCIIHITFGRLPVFVIAYTLIFTAGLTLSVVVASMQLTHKIIHEFLSVLLFLSIPSASLRGCSCLALSLCFSYFWFFCCCYSCNCSWFALLILSCAIICIEICFCFSWSLFGLCFL